MESGLCKYKNIFGEPGKGAHSIRIFNIAVVDVIATLILAFAIHQFLLDNVNIWWIIIGCFLAGILAHRLFCVRTTIDKLLFN